MVEHLEISTVGTAAVAPDWTSTEVVSQIKSFAQKAESSSIRAGSDLNSADSGLKRVFPPGTAVTHDLIEKSGISNDAAQLNLERNLLFRDANPKAYFKTPGLNDKIDQLTGTKGDGTDPANFATNQELRGESLQNAIVLKNHEAVAKVAQWRSANPDKMVDQDFPPRLSPDEIAKETAPAKLQDAINALYAEKGQPMVSDANIAKFARLNGYKPDPTFDESTAFVSDADKSYRQTLIDRRKELLATP